MHAIPYPRVSPLSALDRVGQHASPMGTWRKGFMWKSIGQGINREILKFAYLQSLIVSVAAPASPLAISSLFDGLTSPPPGPFQTTLVGSLR